MAKYFYDLHIHSCLSPCADDDMTPNNIVNMAMLKGLDIVALTDHNSCKNCPAILEAAKGKDLWVIPGMELNTLEEVHVVCLFPDLKRAMEFDDYVYSRIMQVENKPEIFGRQIIMDGLDREISEERLLLISTADISVDSVPELMKKFGGTAFPGHINRNSNSMIAAFGCLPADQMGYKAIELYRTLDYFPFKIERPSLEGYKILNNSDAHYLGDISEPVNAMELFSADFGSLRKLLG